MLVLHLSTDDSFGGAARAAYRIHRSIADVAAVTGIRSVLLVRKKGTEDSTVRQAKLLSPALPLQRLSRTASILERKLHRTHNSVIHSTLRVNSGITREISAINPDVVVLHWLGDLTVSIKEVGQLSMRFPVAWVLHDTWAFCGAEHYPYDENDRRFANGYSRGSGRSWERGLDVNRRTWRRKLKAWRRPLSLIAPSNWMADRVRESTLSSGWPLAVIPYPIRTDWWAANCRDAARRSLGIAQQERIVLFGAVGGERDPRKGAGFLREAIELLPDSLRHSQTAPLSVLTFGSTKSEYTIGGVRVRSVGRLDDEELRNVYSAANVTVVPSRIDNLPQIALESIASGTPVVGFRVGGLPDIVVENVTGRLVQPFSTQELAYAIQWTLLTNDAAAMSSAARESARRWSHQEIGPRFANYFEVLSQQRGNPNATE
jgi:glycosyltransferase involved in cell wall biosynthesis